VTSSECDKDLTVAELQDEIDELNAEVAEQDYLVRLVAKAVGTAELSGLLGGEDAPVMAKVETLAQLLAGAVASPPPLPSHHI